MSAFVPLRVRSHGSLLYGTAAPEALIERALELGYRALALADRDNLYLAVRFHQAARARGLTPLLGAELTHGRHTLLVLPVDRRGYANLCRLLTRRHLDAAFDPVAALAGHADGLHIVVEAPGLAASLLGAGVPAAAGAGTATAARAPRGGLWMGVRGIAVESVRLGERVAAARWLGLPLVATGDCALLAAADHECHRVARTAAAGELIERMAGDAFCARDAWLVTPDEWARRVRAVFARAGTAQLADDALANNAALASRCDAGLEFGVPVFPRAPVPAGETGAGYLLRLGRAGLGRRYGRGARRGAGDGAERAGARGGAVACAAAEARLREELAIIDRLGFTDYFLLVADIVEFARAHGIPTVGRGSGAGSIVAYCLGITNVDPLRYGLYFERFLHPARRDCPDLDIDLCWRRRDEVIAHVYDTYGAERVAMISTHATLGARSAFRETAKALGVPNARVNALARRVPRDLEPPYRERLRAAPAARDVDWSEPTLARALALAERLDGAPRHLSIHSGGVVIGDRPLDWYVPLERAAKGIVVTQFEMRAIEAIGLVKMDLLGNRALTTIGECVELVRAHRGIAIDVDALPDPDPATARRLATGDTLNCFQVESPAMRHLLRMLRARTLDETIAAVALVRPGPAESGMKEAFCRRHRGLEPVTFLHPRLEPVLRGTHGVMLYEEDVMVVAAALTGLSLAEGDELRRAIGAARGDQEFRALERGFVTQARRAGVEADAARAVWRELTRFAAYAFCKAHAAGYGALAYQSTYLKTHHPAEYAVGVLNHHAGMYPTWVHVEDLRRCGAIVLAPCLQRSGWDTTLEVHGGAAVEESAESREGAAVDKRSESRARSATRPASPRSSSPPSAILAAGGCGRPRDSDRLSTAAEPRDPDVSSAVRVGLGRVFGLAQATGERIVAERARRRFASLADLVDRARPTLPELEALILAGALDWTGRTRPSLLLEARAGAKLRPGGAKAGTPERGARTSGAGRLGAALLDVEPVAPLAIPALPEFDAARRVRGEIQATGLWFSAHPLDTMTAPAARRGVVPAAFVPGRVGQRVAVVGLVCATRRVETRTGEPMLFLTLADHSGLVECVLFPDTYRRLATAVRGEVVRAEGRVEETLGATTLTVDAACDAG